MNHDERRETALVARRARSPTDLALRRARRPTQNSLYMRLSIVRSVVAPTDALLLSPVASVSRVARGTTGMDEEQQPAPPRRRLPLVVQLN
jgi:hypothetical protein